jgi:hypothetical protein
LALPDSALFANMLAFRIFLAFVGTGAHAFDAWIGSQSKSLHKVDFANIHYNGTGSSIFWPPLPHDSFKNYPNLSIGIIANAPLDDGKLTTVTVIDVTPNPFLVDSHFNLTANGSWLTCTAIMGSYDPG